MVLTIADARNAGLGGNPRTKGGLPVHLEAEVEQYTAEFVGQRDERRRRLVVRNGHHRPRTVTTAAGPVEVTAPRVNDKRVDAETGAREKFSSKIPAPWCRKSSKISEVLPLYLQVFPQARNQRCWVDKTRNVMNALPKSAQPGAKKALQEIYNAEDRTHAEKAITAFDKTHGALKLVESAQARWRAETAPRLVALVRAGARFESGHLVERRAATAA